MKREERDDVGGMKTRGDRNKRAQSRSGRYPSNVTTDIPQTLEEAAPNPYPVGSHPIRISCCYPKFSSAIIFNETSYV